LKVLDLKVKIYIKKEIQISSVGPKNILKEKAFCTHLLKKKKDVNQGLCVGE
jgi:hypothetical protein